MNEVDLKLSRIRKYFKKNNLFLEILLLNYETFNIYIRIDYMKKIGGYKISWFDLEFFDINKIEKYMGSEYVSSKTIDDIANILHEKNNNYHVECDKNIVMFNGYFNDAYHYQFERYIPNDLLFLGDVFAIIFNALPNRLDYFLYELHAEIMDTKSRYEYHDCFKFDLYNDDIKKIFNDRVIKNGNKYYKDNSVEFLEKIDDKYYAIVKGTEKYLIVIKYDEEEKQMLLYCTCPCHFICKHIYAVIKAIREKRERNFYKVIYINKEINIIDNATNYKHLLCSGVCDDCLEIINKYGEIELVPLLDNFNNLNFKILQDDDKNTLEKELKKIIKSIK